mmetsp:Transcript_26011/g.29741  ORF Transcript_26011/g.29741 Transcript_26011/m.29741 type:complete len:375 (+) Transcript_26011:203-1327(+)
MIWRNLFQRLAIESEMTCPEGSNGFTTAYIFAITTGVVILLVFLLLNLFLLPGKRRQSTKELQDELLSHVIVTGGSSGIGLSIGMELVKRKCKVITLIARNKQKLKEAKTKLEDHAKSIKSPTVVNTASIDVSDAQKVSDAAEKMFLSKSGTPPPAMLFNVAGTSSAKSFVDTDYTEFARLMNINYLGTAYITRAFLPHMISSIKGAKSVVFVSSQAGQVGVYGYTAYSASKFALRGLAESLQMEVLRDNVRVQVAYPPDTDTPGFEQENIGKPEETRLISETAGLFQPESVAKTIVSSALKRNPPFTVYFGVEGWMLSTVNAGMAPVHTNINAFCQIFLIGLLRFISLFYLMDFRNIVRKVGRKNNQEKYGTM